MHLTLKFLGEVKDDQGVEVTRAVTRVAEEAHPFELDIAGCGCFPPRGDVRIVWAGAEESTIALTRSVERLDDELGKLGFPPENRAFSPHITVGRVREDRSRGALRSAVAGARLEPMSQDVNSIVVMLSELSRSGPTYSVISRAAFAGAR
jgi:2'-5' RNA ligase